MKELTEAKSGEPCPQCGGAFVVDPSQEPDAMIARKTKNAANPAAAARFAENVRAKAADEGIIHVCAQCGYKARLKTVDQQTADDNDQAAERTAATERRKKK